jgi:protein ImuB
MRIACLHVPQFALQCVTRADPTLRGAPVAVAGLADVRRVAHGPVVLACSRAAWALGVRVGMTATAARALSPELAIVAADPTSERETVRALADVLLTIAPAVDVGGRTAGGAHLAMYCEVPSKTRGTSFGERVLEKLELLGLAGRVGIADDRFTAWVAASSTDGSISHEADPAGHVVSVPRGGSAAYLAPRPLSLLAISPEVQHMLEALGVRTLGEFAALPAPSVAHPVEADYQALARGESGRALRPYTPEAPIREEVAAGAASIARLAPGSPASRPATGDADHAWSERRASGLAEAIATLAERIAARLAGRGRAAVRLELTASGPQGDQVIAIGPSGTSPGRLGVLATAEELAEAISDALSEVTDVWRLRAAVTGEALAPSEHEVPAASVPESAPAIVDTLSLVLSTTGGSLDLAFGPVAPLPRGPDRRPHRRMRRGKDRRRVEALAQPRLFKL